jgi:transcriptional regulator with XRE-family HTH domain
MTDMFSPGATLRAAREKRKLTQSDIAEATRIKKHMVNAIENNDFSAIPAPLYGKGFIRLYAEAVGVDPEPLVRDYMERHARTIRPSLQSERQPVPPSAGGLPMPSTLDRFRSSGGAVWGKIVADVSSALRDAVETFAEAWARWRILRRGSFGMTRRYTRGYAGPEAIPVWRYAAIGLAVLVGVILVIAAIGKLSARPSAPPRPPVAASVAAPVKPAAASRSLRLVEEPRPTHLRVPTP